jgi:DNA polymerase-3 subunit alpha
MELSDRTNKPKVMEVFLTPRLLSYDRMQNLNAIFGRYAGMDRVELLVEELSGNTMRMELPCRVDARNMLLKAEVMDLIGVEGHVAYA